MSVCHKSAIAWIPLILEKFDLLRMRQFFCVYELPSLHSAGVIERFQCTTVFCY